MKAMEQALLRMIHEDVQEQSISQYEQKKAEIDQRLKAETQRRSREYAKLREQHDKTKEADLTHQLESKKGGLERELISYRQQLLDEIFDMAVVKLRELSGAEFLSLLKSAAQRLRGHYTVCLGEYSKGKLSDADVAQISTLDGTPSLSLSTETIPGRSGFLLLDERAEYSCLFEDLIEEKKNQQLATIQAEVFAGHDGPLEPIEL